MTNILSKSELQLPSSFISGADWIPFSNKIPLLSSWFIFIYSNLICMKKLKLTLVFHVVFYSTHKINKEKSLGIFAIAYDSTFCFTVTVSEIGY